MLVNLKTYKLAKVYSEDYKSINKAIDLSIKALEHYKHYKPVAALLFEMKNAQVILEAHNNTATKVIAQGKEQ